MESSKRPFLIGIAVAALTLMSLGGTARHAEAAKAVPFGPDLAANGWKILTFPRRTPARFSAQGAGGLTVNADRAVAVLRRPVAPSADKAATAQWRWRVERSVGPTDLARKGGDDRALAVYFVFSDAADRSQPMDLANAMQSGEANILVYVWGGSAPKGRFLPSPYLGQNGRTIVLRSGSDPIGDWAAESVDLNADYRRAFGAAAPALVGLAISSDSDDTAGVNRAEIAELSIGP